MYIKSDLYTRFRMRTNIVIDDAIMKEAMELADGSTKKKVVEEALEMLIRIKKQQRIKRYQGKLIWDGNLDEMRKLDSWS